LPFTHDEFYLTNLPTALQQGDIIAGLPLILLPPLDELVIARHPHQKLSLDHLEAGEVALFRESVLSDAFNEDHEYAVVSVQRGIAMILTATCDLDGKDVWFVLPLYPVEGAGLDEGNLNAGKYANLYRLPDHKYLDSSLVDFTDIRPVRSQHVSIKDRIASTTREAISDVAECFLKSYGRPWGYAPDEVIDPIGKYETGKFRCARCNLYDIPVSEKLLPVGASAPICDSCKKVGKRAQWYPLTKHRK